MWLDDLSVVYNPSTGIADVSNADNAYVYTYDKTIYVDFVNANQKTATLSIYDLTGKLVSSKVLSISQQSSLSVAELNSGLYMYQLVGAEIQKSGKLFIK